MSLTRRDAGRALGVVALLALPFLSAEYYFRREAPGQQAGVYLETDHDYAATLLDSARALYSLNGYGVDLPGAGREALLQSPVPSFGRRLSFFVVGSKDSGLVQAAPKATLWCFVVDGSTDRFRDDAVHIPATITQINPGGYRINSVELEKIWGPDRVAFQQYERALARLTGPRRAMAVLIGLEIQDPNGGARTMYSVRVGPPR